jgi:hypothetical protein
MVTTPSALQSDALHNAMTPARRSTDPAIPPHQRRCDIELDRLAIA